MHVEVGKAERDGLRGDNSWLGKKLFSRWDNGEVGLSWTGLPVLVARRRVSHVFTIHGEDQSSKSLAQTRYLPRYADISNFKRTEIYHSG